MKGGYTRVADVSKHALSVNLVVEVDRHSFTEFFTKNSDIDAAVGEVTVGDASGSITLLVTNRHLVALGLAEGSDTSSVVIVKNVLPAVVCGRLRVELNRFSSVCGRHVDDFSVDSSNNVSLKDHDAVARVGG